jgi:sugar lactone lactonase YvrE
MATWPSKMYTRGGDKLVVDRIKNLVFIEDQDRIAFHIFDTDGNHIRSIDLEQTIPEIKLHNEGFSSGTQKYGYRSCSFALADGDKFVVCGRSDKLYIVGYNGSLIDSVKLPFDWTEDIAISERGLIYVLYSHKGILVYDWNWRIIQHVLDPKVYFCSRIAVDSEDYKFVIGATVNQEPRTDPSTGISYANFWANGISKISRRGEVIKRIDNFTNAGGITVDSKGNLYVIERANRTIKKLTSDLELISTINDEIPDGEYAATLDIDGRNNCYLLLSDTVLKFELPV